MELEKFNRQLKLMTLLAGNVSLTITDIAARLGMSRRTVYRYIRLMKDSARFIVEQSGDVFRISKDSPFFRDISDNVSFSEDEAVILAGLITSAGGTSLQMKSIRAKLERIYNYRILASPVFDRRAALNMSRLYEAIKQHRVVILKNYHSLHGDTVSDRAVEPFAFLNANDDVRCYELSSGENKTFKAARAEDVVLLELTWSNTDKHETFHTDLFGFTGKELYRVSLLLGERATRILQEEHPAAATAITPVGNKRFKFCTEVCSYTGIGRFVLGLFDDVQITDSPDFAKYISDEAALLTEKFKM